MLFGALAAGLISGKLGDFYQFGSLFRGLGQAWSGCNSGSAGLQARVNGVVTTPVFSR
jgi:hypothetical protein